MLGGKEEPLVLVVGQFLDIGIGGVLLHGLPSLLDDLRRSPYGLAPEEIEQTWKTMQGRPEFADIEELTNNQNERFLFSTQHLTRRYAKAISDVDDFCD